MKDWLAVECTGAVSYPRARVLWKDGRIKIYTKEGLVASMLASKPERQKGHLWTYRAETEAGILTMRGKCITCGGWMKVARKSSEALWHGTA